MTKAQANALMTALETAAMPASAVMSFPNSVESWAVQLDPSHVYTGEQLNAIVQYCAAHSLGISAQFSALGIV